MEDSGAGYRLLEHTADAGLVAWAADAAGAFAAAARGMFAIILGEDPTGWAGGVPIGPRRVEVEGADWPALLVNWLAELLFLFDSEGLVPTEIALAECAPPRCAARVAGRRLDDPAQAGGVAIKAVTYHQLRVDVTPGRTDVQVIFDI